MYKWNLSFRVVQPFTVAPNYGQVNDICFNFP